MPFVDRYRKNSLLILKMRRQLRQMRRLSDRNSADKGCQTAAVQDDVAWQTQTATTRDVGCQTDVGRSNGRALGK